MLLLPAKNWYGCIEQIKKTNDLDFWAIKEASTQKRQKKLNNFNFKAAGLRLQLIL